jgi:hypothetical protein
MTTVLTIVGGMFVVAAIQDVFHTLFHPSASGDISDWIAHQVWRVFQSIMRHVPSASLGQWHLSPSSSIGQSRSLLAWHSCICPGSRVSLLSPLVSVPKAIVPFDFPLSRSPLRCRDPLKNRQLTVVPVLPDISGSNVLSAWLRAVSIRCRRHSGRTRQSYLALSASGHPKGF